MTSLYGWFYYAIFLIPMLLIIPIAIAAIVVYIVMGMATSDVLAAFGHRTATLTCWHCGKETPANRKHCKHCKKELQ